MITPIMTRRPQGATTCRSGSECPGRSPRHRQTVQKMVRLPSPPSPPRSPPLRRRSAPPEERKEKRCISRECRSGNTRQGATVLNKKGSETHKAKALYQPRRQWKHTAKAASYLGFLDRVVLPGRQHRLDLRTHHIGQQCAGSRATLLRRIGNGLNSWMNCVTGNGTGTG